MNDTARTGYNPACVWTPVEIYEETGSTRFRCHDCGRDFMIDATMKQVVWLSYGDPSRHEPPLIEDWVKDVDLTGL